MIIEQTKSLVVRPGEYPAEITEVEATTGQYGPQLKFVFTITGGGEYSGETLLGWTSAKFNRASRLYQWARAAFGKPIPADYNLNTDHLIGKTVLITVVRRTKDDGSEFGRIDSLSAYTPPAPPEPMF